MIVAVLPTHGTARFAVMENSERAAEAFVGSPVHTLQIDDTLCAIVNASDSALPINPHLPFFKGNVVIAHYEDGDDQLSGLTPEERTYIARSYGAIKEAAASVGAPAAANEKTYLNKYTTESETSQADRQLCALEAGILAMLNEWAKEPDTESYLDNLTELLLMRRGAKEDRVCGE